MKRTLLEILSGLAVLVLLASFHQQIVRLKLRQNDVVELRTVVETAVANASSKEEVTAIREQLTGLVDDRIEQIEHQLAAARRGVEESAYLKRELEAARREAAALKATIERDVIATRELVTTYQNEVRVRNRDAMDNISANRNALERISGMVLPDKKVLTRQLLAPTVQLNGEDTVGSGTLVRSSRDARTGEAENYVLTSYHVVRNILADTPRAKEEGIPITIYRTDDPVEAKGDLVSHDEKIDAALLRLRGDETYEHVARVLPRSRADDVRVWDEIYAIGCPLGNDPIPTAGSISSTHNQLDEVNYWMINAPTYYGNSGGGIYLADSRELVGVFSKIYTHGRGTPVVIPHMGLCTPITSIYAWLERTGFPDVIPQPEETELADLAAPPK